MSVGSLSVWDAYLSVAGEVNKVTEVIGAGLSVAIKLNYRVMSNVVCISSQLIQLLLLLIAKTHDMLLTMVDDILFFLSDIGSGIHMLFNTLHDSLLYIYTHHYDLFRYWFHTSIGLAVLVTSVVLFNKFGILDTACVLFRLSAIVVSVVCRQMTRWCHILVSLCVLLYRDVSALVMVLLQLLSTLLDMSLSVAIDLGIFALLAAHSFFLRLYTRFRIYFGILIVFLTHLLFSIYVPEFIYFIFRRIASILSRWHNSLHRQHDAINELRRGAEQPVAPPQGHTNRFPVDPIEFIEYRINRDIFDMNLQEIEAYLTRRINVDRQNSVYYVYKLIENDLGAMRVTVSKRPVQADGRITVFRKLRASISRILRIGNSHPSAEELIDKTSLRNKNSQRGATVTRDRLEFPECVVCQDASRSVLLLPCRHLCLCQQCCIFIRQGTNCCPMCRGGIAGHHLVYV